MAMTLILHIGAPKTATSTLQNAFFPAHPGLFFLGKEVVRARGYEGWRIPAIGALMRQIEAASFAPDLAALRPLVASIPNDAAGRPVVISDEGLCIFSGADAVAKLTRVMEIFEVLAPFRLIFAVREQLALIKSDYLTQHRGEMLQLPGTRQNWYPDFDRFLDIHFRYACGVVLDSYRYAVVIEKYERLVGRENILVYAFADFERNPIAALTRLCRFMGVADSDPCLAQTAAVHENEHYTARTYALNKWRRVLAGGKNLGRLVPDAIKRHLRRWVAGGKRMSVTPSADAERRVKAYYQADNDVLFAKYGIRL
jgi:hypothetical protein